MNTNELFLNGNKLPKQLTEDELYSLFEQLEHGNTEVRQTIIKHNIRLVLYQVTNRFYGVEYDKKDLVSIGTIGLLKAINTYSISKNIKFGTYATRCIDNEILMFLRKLKKEQNIDSIDKVLSSSTKDDSEIKLGDTLIDNTNIEKEYVDNETYHVIREIVSELPAREKEIIMMYFGFYNDEEYSQKDISEKFKLSRSYISRLIIKTVKKIKLRLEAYDNGNEDHKNRIHHVIDKVYKPDKQNTEIISSKEGKKNMRKSRTLKSIYEYFDSYTETQIDTMLSKLTDEERKLISIRYGNDLKKPVQTSEWNNTYRDKFYGSLVPRMRKLLKNSDVEIKPQKKDIITENHVVLPQDNTIVEQNNDVINETIENITVEDYNKILTLLQNSSFKQIINTYSPEEAVVISLKLGYVDGKVFSTKAISEFLGIDSQTVNNIAKKVLLSYKERINNIMDSVIRVITEESALDVESKRKELNI